MDRPHSALRYRAPAPETYHHRSKTDHALAFNPDTRWGQLNIAPPRRVTERRAEFGDRGFEIPVVAVAVGGVHHHDVGVVGRRGIVQQRPVRRAEVAREQDPALLPIPPQLEPDGGRAEDLPRVEECGGHAGKQLQGFAAGGDAPEPVDGVERDDRVVERLVPPAAMTVPAVAPRLLFMEMRGNRAAAAASERVAEVEMISPRKPCLQRSGKRPHWSRWAWVSGTMLIAEGSKPKGRAFASCSS